MERTCVVPTTHFASKKGFGFCVPFCVCLTLYRVLVAKIVHIDFSAAFDIQHSRNSQLALLFVLAHFLSNRSQLRLGGWLSNQSG